MVAIEELKQRVAAAIDEHRPDITDVAERIWAHPEMGFREHRTAALVAEWFERLDLPYRDSLAITGLRADLDSGREGPTIALLGELDALGLASHPAADPRTGAVHACGHHAQVAALLGAAMGMVAAHAADDISGRVCFVAVPAEECLDLDYRLTLVSENRIKFIGGKPEMIYRGVFDDVDAAMLIHSGSEYAVADSWNGFAMKRVTFRGKAAHSGFSPENGVNALHAANVALAAVNAQRDTFRDCDCVRVHGIITRGGDVVNVVPDDVRLEVQVRGRSHAAISDAARKVDRAVEAGAIALGAEAEVMTVPGYMPTANDLDFVPFYEANIRTLDPGSRLARTEHRGSSTDIGDISRIMPVFHPTIGGSKGAMHTAEYSIDDPETAYIKAAKLLAMTVLDLLHGDAAAGRKLVSKPAPMSRDEYLRAKQSVSGTCRYGMLAGGSV